MENPTLAKILKTQDSKLVLGDKQLFSDGECYLVIIDLPDNSNDSEFDKTLDCPFYVGKSLFEALQILSNDEE